MLNPVPVISSLDPNGLKRFSQVIILMAYATLWWWLQDLHPVFHFLFLVYGGVGLSCLHQSEYEKYTRHIVYGIGCCGAIWMYSGGISLVLVDPLAALVFVVLLSPHLLLLLSLRKGEKVQLLSAITTMTMLVVFYGLIKLID